MKEITANQLVAILVCFSSLVSTAYAEHANDGFKSVKFGTSANQLKDMGFSCESAERCDKKLLSGHSTDGESLFGQPAAITVHLVDDKASVIDVSIEMTDTQIAELVGQSLGAPKIYQFYGYYGDRIRSNYWVFSNGTSIDVRQNLSPRKSYRVGPYILPPTGTVKYRDKNATSTMLQEIEKSSVKPRDF